MARADVVAAEGDEVAEECIRRSGVPPERVVMTPNGRDPEVFRPGPRSAAAPPMVVFVGALTEGKRPERFVEVVAELRAAGHSTSGPGSSATARSAGGSIVPPAAAGVELLGSRSDVAEQLAPGRRLGLPEPTGRRGHARRAHRGRAVRTPGGGHRRPRRPLGLIDGETGFVVAVDDLAAMVGATARLLDDPPCERPWDRRPGPGASIFSLLGGRGSGWCSSPCWCPASHDPRLTPGRRRSDADHSGAADSGQWAARVSGAVGGTPAGRRWAAAASSRSLRRNSHS